MEKGHRFECLIKAYFQKDSLYKGRFSNVWLWSEWTRTRPDFDGVDTGVDLVAEERQGGYCAIQCKCYAPGTRMSKAHLDSFISASARDPFTALRIAEAVAGIGGRALYLVPSIALFQQSMREWAEQQVDAALQAHLATGDSAINLTDAAKIVGCWKALQNPENRHPGQEPIHRLHRAIAFTNTIRSSKQLEAHWDDIVTKAIDLLPDTECPDAFRCEIRHVEGCHASFQESALGPGIEE